VASLDQQIEESGRLRQQLEKGIVERETLMQQCRERVEGAGIELERFDEGCRSAAPGLISSDAIRSI
jgi:chaperonin cofactor prefoldin